MAVYTVDLLWVLVALLGIISCTAWALKADKGHDRAEIMSGLGVSLLSLGVLRVSVLIGDILTSIIIIAGCATAMIYGILHLKARREERSIP